MNTTFSLDRFGHTIKADLMSNYRTYLMWIGASLGVIAVLVFLIATSTYSHIPGYEDDMWVPEAIIFTVGIAFIASVCASTLMSPMADKRDSIGFLTLPSSQLEKFLSRSAICLIVLPMVTLVGLGVIDIMRCIVFRVMYPLEPISPLYHNFDGKIITLIFAYIIALQSLFALGSTVWPKLSAVKTALTLAVIAMVYTWIFVNFMSVIYVGGYHYTFVSPWFDDFINDNIQSITLVFCCIFAAVNYVVAYFRFKESEIIQRW